MPKFFIRYFDVIDADDSEEAKRILLEQLAMDVRNDDVEHWSIEEYVE